MTQNFSPIQLPPPPPPRGRGKHPSTAKWTGQRPGPHRLRRNPPADHRRKATTHHTSTLSHVALIVETCTSGDKMPFAHGRSHSHLCAGEHPLAFTVAPARPHGQSDLHGLHPMVRPLPPPGRAVQWSPLLTPGAGPRVRI